jgi:hypothetical protein
MERKDLLVVGVRSASLKGMAMGKAACFYKIYLFPEFFSLQGCDIPFRKPQTYG